MPSDIAVRNSVTWKLVSAGLVKAALFLGVALYLMASPLIASTIDIHGIQPGAPGYVQIALSIVNAFFPSLAVYATLVAFFPTWRFVRIGLPMVAALTLIVWGVLASQLSFGAFAKYPDDPIQWPLVAIGPIGIVGAGAFVFLLAWSRRPAARVS